MRLILGLALSMALGLAGGARAETPLFDRMHAAVEGLGCENPSLRNSLEFTLLMLSAYGGQPVEVQANTGRYTLVEFISSGKRLVRLKNGRAIVEEILTANRAVSERMLADLETRAPNMCQVLKLMQRRQLKEVVEKQQTWRDYYQPHAALAQLALRMHGCGGGVADGLFGKGSRAAWARAGMRDLGETGLPMPGEVAALWTRLEQGQACGAERGDLSALREVAFQCLGRSAYGMKAREAGWALGAVRDAQAFGDLAGAVWPICRAEMVQPMTKGQPETAPAQTFLRAALAQMAETATGPAQARAAALRAALAEGSEPGEWERPPEGGAVELAPILRAAGADLFLGQAGMPVARDLGGWLLVDGPDYGSKAAGVQAGIAAGLFAGSVSAELQAAMATMMQPSGREAPPALPEDAAQRVRQLLAEGGPYGQSVAGYVTPAEGFSTTGGAWLDIGVDIEGISGLVALADAAQADAGARDVLLAEGDGTALTAVGVLLGEGNTRLGADLALSQDLLRAAAEKGNPYAAYRLALAAEVGLGRDAPDLAGAERLYRQAAQLGQPAAAMRLASWAIEGRLAADPGQQAAWLRQGLGLNREAQVQGAAAPLMQMIRHAPGAFEAGPLAQVVQELADLSAQQNTGFSYGRSSLAMELAQGYAGRVPGALTDPAKAAFWYRRAGSEGRGPLVRLLAARPDLAQTPDELRALADGSLFALYLVSPSAGAFRQALAAQCPTDVQGRDHDCISFMAEAALGALPGEGAGALLEPAHDWLAAAAAAEAVALAAPAQESGDIWAFRPKETGAIRAYARVLAFYGDYAQARAVLAPARSLRSMADASDAVDEITDAAFRRAVARYVKGGDAASWAPVEALLQDLAARGDEAADQFLDMARIGAQAPAVAGDLGAARAQFALAETYGAGEGLGFAARRLSVLEQAAGDTGRAAELEMLAFGADVQRHALTELRLGRLHATMGRVCSLSRSSERLFALDQPDVALVLAKQAVNELQGMRAQLRGLPEKLQMCFRDSVANHYRWLADLFIARDRPAEATAVLAMLKSFETFEFLGQDEKYRGISLDRLPLTGQEQDLLGELAEVLAPTVTAQSLERRALLLAQRGGTLEPAQEARLGELNAALAQARTAREADLARLAQAAGAANRAARVEAIDNSKSMKALLRRAYDGKAAAVHFVVLPERMGAVLTTANSERVFTWDRLGDAPFSESALNRQIADLRALLRDPARDPLAASKGMLELLMPPQMRAELADARVETLIVSADRQLRYLPFAALYDGERFLVEQYDIVNITEAPGMGGADLGGVIEMAGFGTSRAWHGFSALPGVQAELQALMGAGALFQGAPQLDEAFTRDRLAQSLVFADGAGVVHLASHFKLSDSEADSFLLLGDGGRLSIRDIKQGLGMDLDFTEVALLTLSACETGFGGAQADGRELESFAAIAQQEGAASVVATLWPVADRSTARFMALFYGAIVQGGMAPRAALSAAQRAFLAGADTVIARDPDRSGTPLRARAARSDLGARHPFYWAPFVSMEGSA